MIVAGMTAALVIMIGALLFVAGVGIGAWLEHDHNERKARK